MVTSAGSVQAVVTKETYLKWRAWQARFAASCFHTDVMPTSSTLNCVFSPFVISATLFMLYTGGSESTKKKIAHMLNFDARDDPDAIAAVFRYLKPLFKYWKTATVSDNLFISFDAFVDSVYPVKPRFDALSRKLFARKCRRLTGSRLSGRKFVNMLHELSGDRIQSLSRPLKANAGIVSVAFTSLEASWTADEVRCYRAQDFSPHYGMKQKHEYISLLGNLKYHETADFECCCIPLRLGDKSNVTGLGLFLVLMRPKIKGNIYGLQRALRPSTFHSVLDAFDNIETSERKILLPKMILPDEQLEGQPVDFVDHWTATKLLAEDDTFDEVTAGVRLGHFLHYSSISFDEDGVGFCYPRSVTGSSSDSSLRNVTHKGVPAEDNFSLRFDSPFMFLLVDRTHRIPFICGCYAGQPALSVERLRSTRPTSSVCNTNCAKFWNILATNISA